MYCYSYSSTQHPNHIISKEQNTAQNQAFTKLIIKLFIIFVMSVLFHLIHLVLYYFVPQKPNDPIGYNVIVWLIQDKYQKNYFLHHIFWIIKIILVSISIWSITSYMRMYYDHLNKFKFTLWTIFVLLLFTRLVILIFFEDYPLLALILSFTRKIQDLDPILKPINNLLTHTDKQNPIIISPEEQDALKLILTELIEQTGSKYTSYFGQPEVQNQPVDTMVKKIFIDINNNLNPEILKEKYGKIKQFILYARSYSWHWSNIIAAIGAILFI